MKSNFRTEILALIFGGLIILLNFGDSHTGFTIGNLDTIFGVQIWPILDSVYFLGSIIVFLYYGRAKGKGQMRLNGKTIIPLIVFLIALFALSIDDFSNVLRLGLKLPETYWIWIMWLYPLISIITFFRFGQTNEKAML